MAKVYTVNRLAERGGVTTMFQIKDVLKSAGWAVSSSSDGSTVYQYADGLTHSGSGAGGLDNNLAWFHIQDPDGRTSWLIQRSSGVIGTEQLGSRWRIKHLRRPNVTTLGTATQIPFHVESTVLAGGGPDSNPTFKVMFGPSGTFATHTIAQDTPDNGNVYPFWNMNVSSGVGRCGTLLGIEPLLQGTYDPANTDPYCVFIGHKPAGADQAFLTHYANWNDQAENSTITTPWNGYITNFSGSFRTYMGMRPAPFTGVGYPNYTTHTTSSWSSADQLTTITIGRYNNWPQDPSGAPTYAGILKNMRWVVHGQTVAGRKWPNTYNLSTTASVVVGHTLGQCITMPWPENIPAEG